MIWLQGLLAIIISRSLWRFFQSIYLSISLSIIYLYQKFIYLSNHGLIIIEIFQSIYLSMISLSIIYLYHIYLSIYVMIIIGIFQSIYLSIYDIFIYNILISYLSIYLFMLWLLLRFFQSINLSILC